ncbi:MAG: ATP-dependent helicase, partial [Clostridia bacterium]|nr:ATP-dependent helicase [Clostridia bacterium]
NLYDAILDYKNLSVNNGTKEKLRLFGEYLKEIILYSQEASVNNLVKYILDTSLYPCYAGDTDEMVTRRANLDEFQNSVDEYVRMNEGATLTEYLQQITLYSDTDEMDESEYVTIATVHAVKGLEFRCVFMCGLEEDIMPTSRADDAESLEEERRLMYVAITRAKEKLWLTRSKSRYLYGRREPTVRSRFAEELKDKLQIKGATTRPLGYNSGFNGGYRSSYANNYGSSYGGYGGSS